MENKPIEFEKLFSSYKVVERSDLQLLIEEDAPPSLFLNIATFLLILVPMISAFYLLYSIYAILFSSVILLILVAFRILIAYSRPNSITIKKGSIILKYPKMFLGSKAVSYNLAMIKGIYPDPFPTRSGNWVPCVRLLLTNDKSIKIFNGSSSEEEIANTNSDTVARIFSDFIGIKIVFPK